MMGSAQRFVRDDRAQVGWTIIQIAILLIVPIGLFIFWMQYIRRIQADENAKQGPWGATPQTGVSPTATMGDQKRQCGKCGLWVRPPRGSGPPSCPNCMSVL